VKKFIFSENYHLDRAIIDVAKASYLATVPRYNIEKFEKYQGLYSFRELVID